MQRCSRASWMNTRHGLPRLSNPRLTVRLNQVKRFDSAKLGDSGRSHGCGLLGAKQLRAIWNQILILVPKNDFLAQICGCEGLVKKSV